MFKFLHTLLNSGIMLGKKVVRGDGNNRTQATLDAESQVLNWLAAEEHKGKKIRIKRANRKFRSRSQNYECVVTFEYERLNMNV